MSRIMSRIGFARPVRCRLVLTSLLALTFAVACSSTPDPEPPPDPGTGEFSGGSAITGSEVPEPERVRELESVYFDFDRSDIRADARPILRANSQMIKTHSEWRTVTLEGHTDERGSEEYNLALGERRATAAKRYLVDLGVDPGRITTISFGEAAPAVQGHDESAWRWNRRVEFRIAR